MGSLSKVLVEERRWKVLALAKQHYITPKAAARLLSISVAKIYKMIHANEIPFVQVGQRSYRIPEEELQRWLQERYNGDGS